VTVNYNRIILNLIKKQSTQAKPPQGSCSSVLAILRKGWKGCSGDLRAKTRVRKIVSKDQAHHPGKRNLARFVLQIITLDVQTGIARNHLMHDCWNVKQLTKAIKVLNSVTNSRKRSAG